MRVAFDLLTLRPILLDDESKTLTIPALGSLVVDSCTYSTFISKGYHISTYNTVENKFKHLNLLARKTEAGVKDQVYGVQGSSLNIEIDTQVTGPTLELKITNNEAFNVTAVIHNI